MISTRRRLLTSAGVIALAGGALSVAPSLLAPALGQSKAKTLVSQEELMAPGPLPDQVIGSDKAPVTIIEYASMTCPHCAHFAVTTYPELKKRYIDSGKVKFIFREFPLDQLAAAGSMLARCADKNRYFDVVELLFHQQERWVTPKPLPPLFNLVKQVGFTEQSFNACLTNQKLLDELSAARDRATTKFGVDSTPTFFINGEKHPGALSIDEMAKLIDPYLKA